jgi:hypothetical protein
MVLAIGLFAGEVRRIGGVAASRPCPEIPETTVRVARAAFPKGCLAMRGHRT